MFRQQRRRTYGRRRGDPRHGADQRAAAAGMARAAQWVSSHLLPAMGVTALVLCLILGGIVLWGNDFKVREIEVIGADLLEADMLRASAAVAGKSIVTVNPAQVEAKLRSEQPAIAQVTVERGLPNRVTIRLEEEPARWAWESGTRIWWLRADGTVIGEMPDAGRLPVIHDIYRMYSSPVDYIPGVPWALAEALLAALPEIPAFDYSLNEGLIVYVTEKQVPVYLGTGGDARVKIEVLRKLTKQLSQQQIGAAAIDLRNEHKPVYLKPA